MWTLGSSRFVTAVASLAVIAAVGGGSDAEAVAFRGDVALGGDPTTPAPFTNIAGTGNPLEVLLTGQYAGFNDEAIEYFIPLGANPSPGGADPATFGAGGAGQSSDSGPGTPTNAVEASLQMFIFWDFDDGDGTGLALDTEYTLDIFFDDLDLIGATDEPFGTGDGSGLLEGIQVVRDGDGAFDDGDEPLDGTPQLGGDGLFTDVAQSSDITVISDGDAIGERITVDLGMISDFNLAQAGAFEGSYVIRLLFGVTVEDMAAINTSEFLVAFLSTPEDAEIPLPATAWLLLASVGGVALIGRRRRQQAA